MRPDTWIQRHYRRVRNWEQMRELQRAQEEGQRIAREICERIKADLDALESP